MKNGMIINFNYLKNFGDIDVETASYRYPIEGDCETMDENIRYITNLGLHWHGSIKTNKIEYAKSTTCIPG